MHITRWYKTVLGETHTIPGGMNISFGRSSGEGGILGGLVLHQASGAASILAESRPSPGDSKEDSGEGQPSSPGVIAYQEEWGSVDPRGEPSNSREFQVV